MQVGRRKGRGSRRDVSGRKRNVELLVNMAWEEEGGAWGVGKVGQGSGGWGTRGEAVETGTAEERGACKQRDS